jgi:DNA-binding NtrC family response regulator
MSHDCCSAHRPWRRRDLFSSAKFRGSSSSLLTVLCTTTEGAEDIPVLAEYFASVYCAANSLPAKRIADDAMQALKRYAWPGNVRELENAIQRLVIMIDDDTVSLKDLPAEIVQGASRSSRNHFRLPTSGISLDKEIEAFEGRWVREALKQTKNVKSDAARLLGVDRNRLN